MLRAVVKKRAYEDIIKQIRNLIEKGKLKRSDQLPTERELADTFKVSRATVREAIRSLESMRLVESRHGDGTYVLASNEEALVQPLAAALFSEKDNIIDIFYVRKIIESHVAQLAAENATTAEIHELEEVLQDQAKELASGMNIIRTDTTFHNILARMSKNQVLKRLLFALFDLLEQTREKYLQNEERAQKSLIAHREILSTIKSGNSTAARQAMRRHLEEVEGILFPKKKGGGAKS